MSFLAHPQKFRSIATKTEEKSMFLCYRVPERHFTAYMVLTQEVIPEEGGQQKRLKVLK